MKYLVLTIFVFFTTPILSAGFLYVHADTVVNKGVNKDTSLTANYIDSSMVKDSIVNTNDKRQEVFIPLFGLDDSSHAHININHSEILTEDYRNLSDIFSYTSFGFLQDLGALGQPNEQMFYGLGFGNISYNRDGVMLNDRIQNSFNLNKLSIEPIDSIEIAPLAKGFLYNPFNNPVSVTMNSRYKFPKRPVTYLKFYQASYDEGFVDVLFHTPITEKMDFGIDVSNSAIDSRFSNSDYESWKINAQLNYNINEDINIHANYFFSYDTLALFGGLDTNKMLNENFSPVLYPYSSLYRASSRYMLTYNNHAVIKLIAKVFPNSKTDFSFYINSVSQKFRENVDSLFTNLPSINHDNYQFTWGAMLRNIYNSNLFTLDITANYESTTLNTDVLKDNSSINIFSLSGDIHFFKFSKYFRPSLFGKSNNFSGSNLIGYGFAVEGFLFNKVSYFIATSKFQQAVSPVEKITGHKFTNNLISQYYKPISPTDNNVFEAGISFNYNFIKGKISYFNYYSSNKAVPVIIQNVDSVLINEADYFTAKEIKNSGINLNIGFNIWKLLITDNISYYFSNTTDRVYSSPSFTISGKVYYNDFFFNKNLKLKTGINYRFASGQNPFVYDFEKSVQVTDELTPLIHYDETPSSFQMDLFLAGTIQERATIFVTLENLLDSEYYIVPYYFKQAITLRFGVSWILFD